MIAIFHPYIGKFAHLFGSPLCGSDDLPEVDFDYCDPEVRLSEIRRMFIARMDAIPFNDWSNSDEWLSRLSFSNMDLNAIRELIISGEKPLPVSLRKEITNQRKKTVIKEHTISGIVDEVNEANHAFFTAIENGKNYRIWYEIQGGLMFGGNAGIPARVMADMVLARGVGEVMYYAIAAQWKDLRTEDRIQSPIFDLGTGDCGDIDITEINVDWFDDSNIGVSWAAKSGATYEWVITTVWGVPTGAGEPVAENSFTFHGLSPATTYYIFVRAVCHTGTPGLWCIVTQATAEAATGPTLAFSYALRPSMGLTFTEPATPQIAGFWGYSHEADGDFINVYPLANDYVVNNEVKYERFLFYILGTGAVSSRLPESVTPQAAKSIPYKIPCGGAPGNAMLVWSDFAEDNYTRFVDINGNVAIHAPLLVLNQSSQALDAYLLPKVLIEMVSTNEFNIVLRLTKYHDTPPSDYTIHQLDWIGVAFGGDPDPLDPGNPDKTIIVLGAGTYMLGVQASYKRDVLEVHYPFSEFTAVIKVE